MFFKRITLSMILFTVLPKICFSQIFLTNPVVVTRPDSSMIQYYLQIIGKDKPNENLLVLLQGSDCNSIRNNKSIDRLKNVYPDADLLLVEKYGLTEQLSYSSESERTDCPESYILNDNPEQRVNDLDKVISTVRKQYGYKRVIVVGGSEGSLIANMISSRVSYICATVLFGSGGSHFIDNILYSMKCNTKNQDTLNKNIEGFKQLSQYILSHEPFKFSMSNHGYSWWKYMLSVDQEMLLSKIKTPVLLVQGGADQSASPEKATEMVTSLQGKGKTNIEYNLYPKYNHSLNLSNNDNSADSVIVNIKKWLISKINR